MSLLGLVVGNDSPPQDHCHPRHVKREGPFGRGREAEVLRGRIIPTKLIHDVADLVEDLAMAVHDDSDDLVAERQRIRLPYYARGLGGEIMDVNDL